MHPLAQNLSYMADVRILLVMAKEGRPVAEPLKNVSRQIDGSMRALTEVFSAVKRDLLFSKEELTKRGRGHLDVEKIAADWSDVAQAISSHADVANLDAKVVELIASLRGVMAHAADTSNLVLDPDLDSYYLMDVAALALPQAIERLSVVGSEGYALSGEELSTQGAVKMAVLSSMMAEADIARIVSDIDTSMKEDANFHGLSPTYERNIVGVFNDYRAANTKLKDALVAAGGEQPRDREEFVRVFQAAKESAYVFWDVSLDELDKLLDIRVNDLRQQQYIVLLISFAGVMLSLVAFAMVVHSLTSPLTALTDAMTRLSRNDMTVDIPYSEAQSEIGAMARSLIVFKSNAIEAERLREERARSEQEQAASRRQAMLAMAESFQAEVGGVVDSVAAASRTMSGTAHELSRLVVDTNAKSSAVAAASEEASMNVQAVASATEQLSASIAEISQQVANSANVAQRAKEKAGVTNQQMRDLVDAAKKIGVVVSLISDIAEQTNLLALNATIEAARAGDAGKGFAVVAGEVKSLATQTAHATAQIEAQIGSIQEATMQAARAITEIVQTIDNISGIASSVAAAVEQQGAATSEIARNIQQASMGTREVATNIIMVSQAAEQTGSASGTVQSAATALSKQSEQLQRAVLNFVQSMRA